MDYKVKFLLRQLGALNSTGPIRESEAIFKKYFAFLKFESGFLLISQKPIRESEAILKKYFAFVNLNLVLF